MIKQPKRKLKPSKKITQKPSMPRYQKRRERALVELKKYLYSQIEVVTVFEMLPPYVFYRPDVLRWKIHYSASWYLPARTPVNDPEVSDYWQTLNNTLRMGLYETWRLETEIHEQRLPKSN